MACNKENQSGKRNPHRPLQEIVPADGGFGEKNPQTSHLNAQQQPAENIHNAILEQDNSLQTELDSSASLSRFDSDDLSNQTDLNELVHFSENPSILCLDRGLASYDYYIELDDGSPTYCANCKLAGNDSRCCTGCTFIKYGS